jgi:hypothetical protein
MLLPRNRQQAAGLGRCRTFVGVGLSWVSGGCRTESRVPKMDMPAIGFLIFVVVSSDGVVHAETRSARELKGKKIGGSSLAERRARWRTWCASISVWSRAATWQSFFSGEAGSPLGSPARCGCGARRRAGKHHRCGQRAARLSITVFSKEPAATSTCSGDKGVLSEYTSHH